MTQPTNSIDSELEEIVEGLIEIARGWVVDQLDGTSFFKEALDGLETRKSEALQAIKALYRKEIEEAIGEDEEEPWLEYDDSPNYAVKKDEFKVEARNQFRAELRAKLLPPTKGDTNG